MEKFLEGKVAIVTGAGRGLGRAEAIALADAGARVVVNDLGTDLEGLGTSTVPADEVVQEILDRGGQAIANYDSVAQYDAAGRIVQQAVDTYGRVDILVNNAGILSYDTLDEYTAEEWDKVIAVHLSGSFYMCKHVVPHMRAQKYGRIINTTSNAWNLPCGLIGYAAAKGGVTTMTWALAFDLRPDGINVNAIAPFGYTRGVEPGLERKKKRYEKGQISPERYNKTPVYPDASYSTGMLLFLLSPEADEINGCVVRSGGGKVSRFAHPDESVILLRDYEKDGPWTVEKLRELLPATMFAGSKKAPHL
ncbi:SDR family NAD(P)-dependent oxidoreductase [Sphingobium sp.]|uniref:SDR family NAD(P)-dependent oxidoreductase n=1 Tax=Sphingobium sp. TaxID=1912891 RepID=UPI003B3B1956